MVYECLPVKTTHHAFEFDEPDSTLYYLELVWKTLPGVTVLATCHKIHAEASTIIESKLRNIKREPIRLVANSDFLGNDRLQRAAI